MSDDIGAELLTAEGIQNPHPIYDRLRASAPVYWSDALGMWLVTTHQAAREVYRDHERFSSIGANVSGRLGLLPPDIRARVPNVEAVESAEVLNVADPPVHTRHRSFFTRALAPRRLASSRAWAADRCQEYAEQLAEQEHPDLVTDFTTPLAYAVILELFGSPLEHVPVYARTAQAFFAFHALGGATPEHALTYEAALIDLRETLAGLYDSLRDAPPDTNVLASLLNPPEGADAPDDLELFVLLRKFFAAGHENLIHTTAVTVMELLRHPEQHAMVLAEPSLVDAAYAEALRWEPPNQGNQRVAVGDFTFWGQPIRAGESVMALKAAAARDPSVWSSPGTFDLTRNQNEPPGGNLSFGQGIHFCIGAGLARMVGPLAVWTLLERFPRLRLPADFSPTWEQIPLRRTLTALPVELG